jgi:integrase
MAVKVRERTKGSGIYWIFIDHQGKRKSKKIGRDKRLAQEAAKKIEAKLALGEFELDKQLSPTFIEYAKQWLSSLHNTWAPGTRKNYSGAFRLHIEPELGSKRLYEVARMDVKSFVGNLKSKGLSTGRMETILQALRGMFNEAVDDGVISFSPCQRMGRYSGGSKSKKRIDPLTADELAELLDNALRELDFVLYVLFLLGARSGLRIGEILALEWSDVDFKNRTVSVHKSWDYLRQQSRSTKNKKPRKVDLTPMTIEALRRLRNNSKVVAINIFVDERGERLSYQMVYKALQKVARRPLRIHDLRHTYATLRVAKGDNIVDVSNQLGHHDPGFTLKRYAHWIPGEHKAQVDQLDMIATSRNLSATNKHDRYHNSPSSQHL